jgi:pyruvate/2-oxoglutarate dehydrogenase complex dihydrolipoamide dehydrogenase (E3) component
MRADVIIIGSGQAGVPLASRLARAGNTVLIVERANVGGTCINYGCTPTKTMVASARAAYVARTGIRLGVRASNVEVDLAAVVERKDALVRRFRESAEDRLRAERIQLLRGHARFAGHREIEVNGERHQAETIIINVGARAAVPAVPGLERVPWLDNNRMMQVRELPAHLLVLGGGYIGCEFAQMFRRFGSRVTIVQKNEHLLNREDPDAAPPIEAVFRSEGIDLELGARVKQVSREDSDIVLGLEGRELRGSHLLVAVGRRPNTDDLGCEAGGIDLDKSGYIIADDKYRTSAPGVRAVADVLGGPQFTHVAWDDHRILFDLLMGRSTRGRSGRFVPHTTFTDPQVAGVGLTEPEAKTEGVAYEVATMPFGDVARAMEVDETAGIMKVLMDPDTERVLGATIVGAEAGELIHIFVTLMQARASLRAIVDAEAVHPTFAEGVQSLVMRFPRFRLS